MVLVAVALVALVAAASLAVSCAAAAAAAELASIVCASLALLLPADSAAADYDNRGPIAVLLLAEVRCGGGGVAYH